MKSSSAVFLLAGYETTGNALAFFSQQIARHPRVQQKLHEEIANTFDADVRPVLYLYCTVLHILVAHVFRFSHLCLVIGAVAIDITYSFIYMYYCIRTGFSFGNIRRKSRGTSCRVCDISSSSSKRRSACFPSQLRTLCVHFNIVIEYELVSMTPIAS